MRECDVSCHIFPLDNEPAYHYMQRYSIGLMFSAGQPQTALCAQPEKEKERLPKLPTLQFGCMHPLSKALVSWELMEAVWSRMPIVMTAKVNPAVFFPQS